MSCCKAVDNFRITTGPFQGREVIVDGPEYETIAGLGSNCGIFDSDHIIEANFYCDNYGIDTISFGTLTAFLMECYESGFINREMTNGLELNFGNKDAAMELLHQMGSGKGFGPIAGMGIRRLKKHLSDTYGVDSHALRDIGMESKGMEFSLYVTKECLPQQAGYGLANKGPHHDETCFVWNPFKDVDEITEALFWFPMFRTWFSLNGLCKIVYNDIIPPDNDKTEEPLKIPEHVRGYARYFSGVTGREVTEDDLVAMSERVYNFQRVFNLKMGFGTRQNDVIPYRAMGPVTEEEYESRRERYDAQLVEHLNFDPKGLTAREKMQILRKYREEQFELLRDAIYERRGWDGNGIPTPKTLRRLQIDFPDVVDLVKKHG
jgi:aldehyde:ferredoxin oxidoreductase